MAWNVTSVAQSDTNGYGPAYLLNGLTSAGYWYQVGISYDWPYTGGGFNPGFHMNYNVFDSTGHVVLPSTGGGGIADFSGVVYSGDPVLLNLYFNSGNVIMLAKDMKTGALAWTSYNSKGASSFTGSSLSAANLNGFFTGLMTEWYHTEVYTGTEEAVTYSESDFALSSAWMWIDEYNPSTGLNVFQDTTPSPVDYTSNPTILHVFSSHGASEASNAHSLVTGSLGCGEPATPTNANSLVCNGLGPTTIGLSWGQSGYLLLKQYQVRQSTTGPTGPWTTLDTISTKSNTTDYFRNLNPTTTYWWQVVDVDCCGANATTNVLGIKQSSVATLSKDQISDTTYTFSWKNNANYTGSVAFDSYKLEESINGGSYSVVYNTSTLSDTTYTLTLAYDTQYSFRLVTTDKCSTCSSPGLSSSNSNTASIRTPLQLVALATGPPPGSADAKQIVSFTCNAAGGVPAYDYSWSYGDGSTGHGQTTTHSYDSFGTKNVICTVTDNLHSSTLGITSAIILADPTIAAPQASRSSVDIGQIIQFTTQASGGSGGFTYSWLNLPSGCFSSSSAYLSCQPTGAGVFTPSVRVTDSNGFSADSSVSTIVVYEDPSISRFTISPSTIDLGQSISTETMASGGSGALSYSISGLPAGCTSTNNPALSCTPAATGIFQLSVRITDSNGFSSFNGPIPLTVNPDTTATLIASSSALDAGQTVTLTLSVKYGTGPFTYSYQQLPNECTASSPGIFVCNFSTSGSYTIMAMVTDSVGQSASSSLTLTVSPDPSLVSFATSSSTMSVGEDTALSVSVAGGSGPLSYSFSGLPPGCSSTDSATLTCHPSSAGTYDVRVTATDHAGKTVTGSVSIIVGPQKYLGFTLLNWVIVSVVGVAVAASLAILRYRKRGKNRVDDRQHSKA
jgi:hypothetical protein